MSTPQHPPRAPKRSTKKNKLHPPPAAAAQLRGAVSENELSHPQIDPTQESKGARRKSNANSHKKPNAPSGNVSDALPERVAATPIKQPAAYAGATFTNSPAASALPIPSFYSRSVPNVTHVPSQPTIAEHDSKQSTPVPVQDDSPSKRESTPLDFLFNAARQSKATPRGESPSASSSRLSVAANSPLSRSPAPRDQESMFPFELDGASTPGEDGSSFATPFKERIEEARKPSRPTSSGLRDQMTEAERQEKSAALKKLLIKESSPSPPSNVELNNPFNARAPQPRNHLSTPSAPPRPRSSPSTPGSRTPNPPAQASHQYFPAPPHFPQYALNHAYRQTSNLRNHYDPASEPELAELSSDSGLTPPKISTARKTSVPTIMPSPISTGLPQGPAHKAKPSIQQMEEQMRTFLKLDMDLRSKG